MKGQTTKMKKLIAILVALVMIFALAACANNAPAGSTPAGNSSAGSSAGASSGASATTTPSNAAKKDIKFYGKIVEYTSGVKMTDALVAAEKDKYNIDAIQVDWTNLEKVIRTGIASGDPCDVYCFWGGRMSEFKDMAVDLTPYLDADPAWKAQFSENDLAAETVDGKILGAPWESNFSVILVNKKLVEDLGITIPDQWTIDEFNAVAKKIKDAGVFPFANATDNSRGDWIYRNAILSTTVTAGTYEQYTQGQMPYTGPETTKALNAVKSLFDNQYLYPGAGAVTAKSDEIKAAFSQGKIAMMAEIAAGAKTTASQMGFDIINAPWPNADTKPALLGGLSVMFVPKNCKDIDAAVDVVKAWTSKDVMSIHAEEGYIPVNTQLTISDPFITGLMKQTQYVKQQECPAYLPLTDYATNNLQADLVLNGGVQTVEQQLEKFRQDYLASLK